MRSAVPRSRSMAYRSPGHCSVRCARSQTPSPCYWRSRLQRLTPPAPRSRARLAANTHAAPCTRSRPGRPDPPPEGDRPSASAARAAAAARPPPKARQAPHRQPAWTPIMATPWDSETTPNSDGTGARGAGQARSLWAFQTPESSYHVITPGRGGAWESRRVRIY
jgi:hypothetical protein